jgi:hypothetical protein
MYRPNLDRCHSSRFHYSVIKNLTCAKIQLNYSLIPTKESTIQLHQHHSSEVVNHQIFWGLWQIQFQILQQEPAKKKKEIKKKEIKEEKRRL